MAQRQIFIAQTALAHHLLSEIRISYLYTLYTRKLAPPDTNDGNRHNHREPDILFTELTKQTQRNATQPGLSQNKNSQAFTLGHSGMSD